MKHISRKAAKQSNNKQYPNFLVLLFSSSQKLLIRPFGSAAFNIFNEDLKVSVPNIANANDETKMPGIKIKM